MRTLSIQLSGCRFHSHHGVFPQERTVGNEFIVDATVVIPAERVNDDNIATSISYADLYEIIKKEMDEPRLLLETVAGRIVDRVLSKYPEIINGSVTICKPAPPISGFTGEAKICVKF